MQDILQVITKKKVQEIVYRLTQNEFMKEDCVKQKSFVINTIDPDANIPGSYAFYKKSPNRWEYQMCFVDDETSPFYVCPYSSQIFKNNNWATRVQK